MRKGKSAGLVILVVFAGLIWLMGTGFAQEKFPNRPIQFVIPWAAGGAGP